MLFRSVLTGDQFNSGLMSAGNVISTNGYFWSNGKPYSTGGGTNYGNANVAAYLPTYSGNINAGGNIYAAQGFNTGGIATVNYLISNSGISGTTVSASGAITANSLTSNTYITAASISSTGTISAPGQITGGLLVSNSTILGNAITANSSVTTISLNATGTAKIGRAHV